MDAPLWRPSPERIAASGISRLAVEAERRWGVRCEDFSALHRWSVEAPEQFWCEVWRLGGVVAERRGESVLHHAERMPGAEWFPDARLNFAELTQHGGVIIHGRSDATLNPGGVRIGTAEIYRQVERVDEVLESLVIGQDFEGDTRVVLFVRLREGLELDPELEVRIRDAIRRHASPRHVPAVVAAVPDIPRTRSGKIVELAVRDVVHGRAIRNREAIANPEALDDFAAWAELARC